MKTFKAKFAQALRKAVKVLITDYIMPIISDAAQELSLHMPDIIV